LVSLPSSSAFTPRRPCEAMKIRSQPLSVATWMISSNGPSLTRCRVVQGTPAARAASSTAPSARFALALAVASCSCACAVSDEGDISDG
jgi:hypothetical protein